MIQDLSASTWMNSRRIRITHSMIRDWVKAISCPVGWWTIDRGFRRGADNNQEQAARLLLLISALSALCRLLLESNAGTGEMNVWHFYAMTALFGERYFTRVDHLVNHSAWSLFALEFVLEPEKKIGIIVHFARLSVCFLYGLLYPACAGVIREKIDKINNGFKTV